MRPYNTRLTYEQVASRIAYNPNTGLFTSVKSGKTIGHIDPYGYGRIMVCAGEYHRSHRLAWLLTHKQWPDEQIDHINGDRLDNRIHNLREATVTQNLRNRPVFKNNKLGVKGVCREGNRFRAQLWKDGKFILTRTFATVEEASAAYQAAALEAFGVFHRMSAPIRPSA